MPTRKDLTDIILGGKSKELGSNIEPAPQDATYVNNPIIPENVVLSEEEELYKFNSIQKLEEYNQADIEMPIPEEIILEGERNSVDYKPIEEYDETPALSLADPKDLQKKLVNLGFDIGKTGIDGIIGRNTTRALQEFLVSKGYKLPKYGIDGKLGKETLGALKKYNEDSNKIKSPYASKYSDQVGYLGKCDEDQCAAFVQNEFRRNTGINDLIQYGIFGNAWEMAGNILKNGGTRVYKDGEGLKNSNKLMPGSFVTMYTYGASNYQDEAGEGNPTHIGVVDSEVMIDPKSKRPYVYVLHNIHKKTLKGYQGRIFRHKMYLDKPTVMGYKVIDIVTPNVEGKESFKAKPNPNIKIVPKGPINDIAANAINKVNNMDFKKKFMQDYKLTEEEYQSLAKSALGIMGQESKFGEASPVSFVGGEVALSLKELAAKLIAPFRGVEASEGYSRLKFDTNFAYIKKRLYTDYGISEANTSTFFDDGSNSIVGAMLVLGNHYNNLKKLEGLTPEDALYLSIQKYNRYNLSRKINGKSSYEYGLERDLDYSNKALMYSSMFESTDGKNIYSTLVNRLNRDPRIIRKQARRFNNLINEYYEQIGEDDRRTAYGQEE